MKALGLALLALLAVHVAMKEPKPPQRTPTEAKAWGDWFTLHTNGGGV